MSRKNRRQQQNQKPRPTDLVEIITIDDAIELKMQELRAPSSHYIEPAKRRNYDMLLKGATPEVMTRILGNLLQQAQSDSRVGFAMLQYLIGKPREINTSPNVVMDELRGLIVARMATQVPKRIAEE